MKKQISGIYQIKSKIKEMSYIGRSEDIGERWKQHISELKRNKHINSKLQNHYNSYSLLDLEFSILEECSIEVLVETEQKYLDTIDLKNSFNLTKNAYGGGHEATQVGVYLIDLYGSIVQEFSSGNKCSQFLKRPVLDYKSINTKAITKHTETKKLYRIVTIEYYHNNIDTILTWRTNKTRVDKKPTKKINYSLTKNGVEEIFHSIKSVCKKLGITDERVRQLVKNNGSLHKKSGYFIKKIVTIAITK